MSSTTTEWSPDGNSTASGATTSTTDLSLSGNLSTTGTSTLTGAAILGSTLAVTGATTLSAAATLSSTLNVTGDATFDTKTLFVDVSENAVGIGTITPAVDLDIEDTTTSSTTQGGNLRLGSNDGAVMASGHRLGVLEFAGAEDTSSTMTIGARIEAVTDATWSASENGANLNFYTTDGNASQTQRMTILAAGNVGIGTAAPNVLLHVETSSAGSISVDVKADDFVIENSGNCGMSIYSGAASSGNIYFADAGDDDIGRLKYDHSADSMDFWVNAAERMTILSSGNVGIGTAAPSSLLQVHNNTGAGTSAISISAKNDGISTLLFGETDSPDPNGGAVEYRHVSYTTAADRDKMFFRVADGYRMAIDSSGNVGIGTTAPARTLEVSQTSATAAVFERTGSSGNINIEFKNDDGDSTTTSLFVGMNSAEDFSVGTTNDLDATGMLTIDSTNGKVGIGTAAPAEQLEVSSTASAACNILIDALSGQNASLQLGDDNDAKWKLTNDAAGHTSGNDTLMLINDGTTEVMTITQAGDVGIGTASPLDSLHIAGDDDDNCNVVIQSFDTDTASNSPNLQLLRSRGTQAQALAGNGACTIADGDFLGQIQFGGFLGSTGGDYYTNYDLGAAIQAVVDGTPSNANEDIPTEIRFLTSPDIADTGLLSRMSIMANGNVGIGISAPLRKLSVVSGSDSTAAIAAYGADTTGVRATMFGDNAGDYGAFYAYDENGGSGSHVTKTVLGSATDGVGIVVDANNSYKVGIGVASPSHLLHVVSPAGTSAIICIEAASLDADNELLIFNSRVNGASMASMGTYYNDVAGAGTLKYTSYLKLDGAHATAGDGTNNHFWCGTDAKFRYSTDASQVGGTGGAVVGDQTSDERLKNISSDPFPYGLTEVNKLTPIAYTLKPQEGFEGGVYDRNHLGFGAQTLQKIIPEPVIDTGECPNGYDKVEGEEMKSVPRSDEKNKLGMEYHQLIPVLVKAVQELSAKVTALENA